MNYQRPSKESVLPSCHSLQSSNISDILISMIEEIKYDVFISYSRKDYIEEKTKQVIPGNIVSQIREMLDANNISYWFDEEGIYSGDVFAPIIAESIMLSKIFLFISTENSNASVWARREIAVAGEYNKKIIPIKYDNARYSTSVIMILQELDYIECKSIPFALSHLLSSIQRYLETEKEREDNTIGAEEYRKNEEKSNRKQDEKLQFIRTQLDNLETQKNKIEKIVFEEKEKLLNLHNEKRTLEDKILELRHEMEDILGGGHPNETKEDKGQYDCHLRVQIKLQHTPYKAYRLIWWQLKEESLLWVRPLSKSQKRKEMRVRLIK